MKKLLILTALAVVLFWTFTKDRAIEHPPGVLAPKPPMQEQLEDAQPIAHGVFSIQPLARFLMTARVLSAEDYWLGRETKLSRTDVAFGWGKMSDSAVLDQIDISQSGRWYRWRVQSFPIPRQEIENKSANMHLIPGSKEIGKKIGRLRTGSVVKLKGYLVEVTAPDGWKWRSSLTRNDSGSKACEVVYVEELTTL